MLQQIGTTGGRQGDNFPLGYSQRVTGVPLCGCSLCLVFYQTEHGHLPFFPTLQTHFWSFECQTCYILQIHIFEDCESPEISVFLISHYVESCILKETQTITEEDY